MGSVYEMGIVRGGGSVIINFKMLQMTGLDDIIFTPICLFYI